MKLIESGTPDFFSEGDPHWGVHSGNVVWLWSWRYTKF